MAGFVYQDPFPLGKDETKFRLLEGSGKYVSTETFNGQEVLKVDPEGLKVLANQAMREVSFRLRPAHNEQVAKIFADPESSRNDKEVAYAMLRNAEVAANYVLPVHYTSNINRSPQSPTQASVTTPDYRKLEGKIQLSLRTKIFQGLLLPDADHGAVGTASEWSL